MSLRCLHCGATIPDGQTCEDLFNAGQALEFSDPAYFAVHHLSVPSYLLQHNRYSRDGWLWAYRLLARLAQGQTTPEDARRTQRSTLDSGNRTYSFSKGPKLAGVEAIAWTHTVADVRLDTAEQYCADAQAWAASVVRDAHGLAREANGGE